jgi:hypothetical protein
MDEALNVRKALAPYVNEEEVMTKEKEQYRSGGKQNPSQLVRYRGDGVDLGEGESSNFNGSQWAQKGMDMKRDGEAYSAINQDGDDYYFNRDEVGIKHPTLGSVVKLTDDGFIDIFADDQLGIRIDPHSKSINILGDTVNLFTKKFNVKTTPNGFIWNDYYFNPQLYYEDEKERGQKLAGSKEYYHPTHEEEPELKWHRDPWELQPMKRSQTRFRYSEGVQDIMKDLGLTTPDE